VNKLLKKWLYLVVGTLAILSIVVILLVFVKAGPFHNEAFMPTNNSLPSIPGSPSSVPTSSFSLISPSITPEKSTEIAPKATAASIPKASVAPTTSVAKPGPKTSQSPVKNYLAQLQMLNTLNVKISGSSRFTAWTTDGARGVNSIGQIVSIDNISVSWNGTSFSGVWATVPLDVPLNNPNDHRMVGGANVTGTVSADGNTLLTLDYSYNVKEYFDRVLNNIDYGLHTRQIQLQNVPLNDPEAGIGYFEGKGRLAHNYIRKLAYLDQEYLKAKLAYEYKYSYTYWSTTGEGAPTLEVIFGK
jgi:hypothetical protein